MIELGNNVAYAPCSAYNSQSIQRKSQSDREWNGTLASVKIDDIVYLLAHSALSFNKKIMEVNNTELNTLSSLLLFQLPTTITNSHLHRFFVVASMLFGCEFRIFLFYSNEHALCRSVQAWNINYLMFLRVAVNQLQHVLMREEREKKMIKSTKSQIRII